MPASVKEILAVLDGCCSSFTFPMLDNGYVYLAATRLALFRSVEDWAMTIEVFGYSPRTRIPDTSIVTFGSRLQNRKGPEEWRRRADYENYLVQYPNDEVRFVFPIDEPQWQEHGEFLSPSTTDVALRGRLVVIPGRREFEDAGIDLQDPQRIAVFELSRYLARAARQEVLATPEERCVNVRPEMTQVLQLEEWHHPDVVNGELPSASTTFQQLAEILVGGDVSAYRPEALPNTHWRHWPGGGTF